MFNHLVFGQPAISEFMASNSRTLQDEDGEYSDWIEIYNESTNTVSLLNWALTDNSGDLNKWLFPATNIGPRRFVIVFASGKDRRVPGQRLHANFRLSATGDYLALVRPDGTIATQFAPAFPSQVADVSYGIGVTQTLFSIVATNAPVRAFVPTSESLSNSWMFINFDDGEWMGGVNGVGYDTGAANPGEDVSNVTYTNLIGTDVRGAMLGINSSCYIRYTFTVDNPALLTGLTLRLKYDDGFAAYLNGTLAGGRNAPPELFSNPLAWNAPATTYNPDTNALAGASLNIFGSVGALVPGTNVLAIQGLNSRATNSDFLIHAELIGISNTPAPRFFTVPTPGAVNGSGTADLGPVIDGVARSPAPPQILNTTNAITVTARVQPSFAPVTNVVLAWRVMYGGTNLAQMFDDGLHGDGIRNDGVFGATIPAGVAARGQMLRWSIRASDSTGRVARWPLLANPATDAQYEGTMIADPTVSSRLPIWHFFVDAPNQPAIDTESGGRGSLFFDGEFYDNIEISVRGNTTSTYSKKSHRINFSAGRPLKNAWPGVEIRNTSLLAEMADPAYLRTHLSFWLLDQMGVPSPFCEPVHARLNGAFWGLYFHNDTMGPEQLERLGYDPSGALYKSVGTVTPDYFSTAGFEKRTRLWESRADFDALARTINQTNTLANRRNFIFDNLNIPEIVNYLAVAHWNQEGDDVWANMTLYRDTLGTKEWSIIPYDLNVSWGLLYCADAPGAFVSVMATNDNCKSHPLYGGSQVLPTIGTAIPNQLYDVIIAVPETRQMLLRRERTLLDKFIQPPGTTFEQGILEQHIAHMTNLMWPEMFMDRLRNGWPCGTVGSPCLMYCWGNAWPTNTHYGIPGLINEFINPRRQHFFGTHCITNTAKAIGVGASFNAGIPLLQPANSVVSILGLDYSPVSGNQDQEYVRLTNSMPFAVDISGWKLEGGVDFTFKPGTIMPSNSVLHVSPDVNAFRGRTSSPRGGQGLFVVGPYQGRLSARGETISITDDRGRHVTAYTYAGNPSLTQRYLRVTEIMFHPRVLAGNTNGSEEFEYMELRNISTNVALNLMGVHFSDGIDFTFGASGATNLAPGQRVLVVRNVGAFTARYGTNWNVAGEYGGALDNGGERLRLLDAVNEEILDFDYENDWYPTTDGFGFSLVIVDENAEPDAWSVRTNWRPSGELNGSPGGAEPAPVAIPPVLINEALTRSDNPPPTDSIELHNLGSANADISGWFLSDDFNTPKKFRIPDGSVLGPGSYAVFTESDFNPNPGVSPSFALSSEGDEVFLFSANTNGDLTGYFHGFDFGAADDNVSFGRYVTSEGREHFVAQVVSTPGGDNAAPRVGPVVITEIMFRPQDLTTNDDAIGEFIELFNLSSSTVQFFDPQNPTNTWRMAGGVDFVFPMNQVLAPGEYLLLVNFDPARNAEALSSFRAGYGVSTGVRLLGPYGGRLNNDQDNIEVKKPATSLPGKVPFVLVDKVEYRDSAPWSVGADGTGASIQRITPVRFGNDPTNWVAAVPTPGGFYPAGGAAPTLTTEPSNQTVVASSTATFTVAGTGALRYQWRLDGHNLPGATNAALALSNVQPSQAGNYSVIAFNDAGFIQSSNALLTVTVPAQILIQPQSQTVFPTSNIRFSVLAFSLGPIRYQWQFNGANLPGATNDNYLINNVQPLNDGDYSVMLTDNLGANVSEVARLIVITHPVFTLEPINRTVAAGSNVTLAASATSSTPVRYQWRFRGTNLVGATAATLTISNVQPRDAGQYAVVASDNYGSITSSNATLTVPVSPAFLEHPRSLTVAVGSNVTFSVTMSNDATLPIGYRWRRTGTTVTNLILNQYASAYNVIAQSNDIYTVVVTNLAGGAGGGLQSSLSSNAYLTVMVPPTNQTAVAGTSVIFSTAPVGPASIRYQWQFNGANVGNATNASLVLGNLQASDAGTYTVVVNVVTNAVVQPAAFSATLQVRAAPTLSNPQLPADGRFRMLLQGRASQRYLIEVSSTLSNWSTVATVTATNDSMPFVDNMTNRTQRFYRARLLP